MAHPYLSVAELVNAPTGINWKNIPTKSASGGDQANAQMVLIREASEWCDQFVQQGFDPVTDFTLSATQNVQTEALVPNGGMRARWLRDGTLKLFSKYLPIISIDKVEWSLDAADWTELTGCTKLVEGIQSARIIPGNNFQYSGGSSGFGNPATGWARWTYTNGFPNALLTGSVLAAATSYPLDEVSGIQPGSVLTVADGPSHDEQITVASSWTPTTGAATIPLVTGCSYAHSAGVSVHAMRGVRRACLEAVRDLVSDRGFEGVTLAPSGSGLRPVMQRADASHPPAVSQALSKAEEYLRPWRRVI